MKRLLTPINAVTADTTSDPISVKNAKRITALFTRANHSSGSSAFSLLGSIDGTTFIALPLLKRIANTNTQTLTRVTGITLSADGSEMVDVEEIFCNLEYIKAVVDETTDGTHTVKLLIEDELVS